MEKITQITNDELEKWWLNFSRCTMLRDNETDI